MSVDMVEHLARLPGQEVLFCAFRGAFHQLRISLPSQQRGSLDYRSMRRLSLVKVSNGRIQKCYYMVHPIARSGLAELLAGLAYRLCLSEVTIHQQRLPPHSTSDTTV
jgi:hypothetical protein